MDEDQEPQRGSAKAILRHAGSWKGDNAPGVYNHPGQEGAYWAHWKPGYAELGSGWEVVYYVVVELGSATGSAAKRLGWDSVNLESFDIWIGPFPEPPPIYDMRSPRIVP